MKKLDIGTTYPVGIELDKALKEPGGDADLVLREGDRIIIPEYNGTVKISGDVLFPNTVSYEKGKKVSYYIDQAGGWGNRAKKSQTYIIYMNGTVAKVGHGTKVRPGCEIVVPSKPKSDGGFKVVSGGVVFDEYTITAYADGKSAPFGIPCVYSSEPLRQPEAANNEAIGAAPGVRIGFGSSAAVTGTVGLRVASLVINAVAFADGKSR